MPRFKHIFLDDGGVMNDNSLRAPQWQTLVGEFFVPRLGGSHDQWAEANRVCFAEVFAWLESQLELEGSEGWSYDAINTGYELRWLRSMMAHVAQDPAWRETLADAEIELATPDKASRRWRHSKNLTDDQCVALAHEAQGYITRRVQSAFPGTAETLRNLNSDYELFTASMGPSFLLRATLEAMGVADLFTRLYGPDLINATKQGPNFYTRMFEHAGVDPKKSVVLDDTPAFITRINAAGATPVLVGNRDPGPGNRDVRVIAALSELPNLLAQLQS